MGNCTSRSPVLRHQVKSKCCCLHTPLKQRMLLTPKFSYVNTFSCYRSCFNPTYAFSAHCSLLPTYLETSIRSDPLRTTFFKTFATRPAMFATKSFFSLLTQKLVLHTHIQCVPECFMRVRDWAKSCSVEHVPPFVPANMSKRKCIRSRPANISQPLSI